MSNSVGNSNSEGNGEGNSNSASNSNIDGAGYCNGRLIADVAGLVPEIEVGTCLAGENAFVMKAVSSC